VKGYALYTVVYLRLLVPKHAEVQMQRGCEGGGRVWWGRGRGKKVGGGECCREGFHPEIDQPIKTVKTETGMNLF